MRVVIIRPELQAKQTAAKLAALGHDPVILPMFQPMHDLQALAEALKSDYSALAVTSTEAVRCLQEMGAGLEPYLSRTVFTVGETTARFARKAGFTNVIAASGNGKDLAAIVAGYAASAMHGKPILYLAGRERTGIFEDTLNDNDIDCVTVPIYHMQPLSYSLQEQQATLVTRGVDAAFLFSRENAKAFFGLDVFQQSREALKKTLFFCLSRSIADIVPDALRDSAVISLNPNEDELIDLL